MPMTAMCGYGVAEECPGDFLAPSNGASLWRQPGPNRWQAGASRCYLDARHGGHAALWRFAAPRPCACAPYAAGYGPCTGLHPVTRPLCERTPLRPPAEAASITT